IGSYGRLEGIPCHDFQDNGRTDPFVWISPIEPGYRLVGRGDVVLRVIHRLKCSGAVQVVKQGFFFLCLWLFHRSQVLAEVSLLRQHNACISQMIFNEVVIHIAGCRAARYSAPGLLPWGNTVGCLWLCCRYDDIQNCSDRWLLPFWSCCPFDPSRSSAAYFL